MQAESYFNIRMQAIGCSNQQQRQFTGTDAAGNPVQRILFEETEKGNVRINYYRLDGNPYTYHATKTDAARSWAQPYYRERLITPWIDGEGKEHKYYAPKGSHNCPYFPASIIAAYKAKTKIPLLIVTEGEFKAVTGCNNGLYVVGIAGTHGFYDPDNAKQLHSDLLELVKVCQVDKLLYLTDADTLTIEYKPDKELSKRPGSFYAAVRNYREAAMYHMSIDATTPLRDVYFGHINTQFVEKAKGLDDLLNHYHPNQQNVIAKLTSLSFDNDVFSIFNITDGLSKISDHFGLSSVEKFYTVYSDFIGTNEFRYKKLTYRWNDEEKQLTKIIHEDINKFMRIGCDWFKLVQVPSKFGYQEEIKKWKVSEIARDYGRRYPTFLDEIPKYDSWCNVPAMQDNYKRIHDNCFNLFNPIQHQPAAGTFINTAMFIKHLFGGAGSINFLPDGRIVECCAYGDPFTVAMDYLTLIHRDPLQIQPVLCLVSPENNTGKTTFLKWLRDIYTSNATILDNQRFKQSFNSHYITKYIIAIDEGFLDVDKREEKERLKKLATDDRQFLEFKGADIQEIPFYGKLIICSNDADNLMKIDEGEIRWFVVRVHPFAKEMPNLGENMRAEIPAWLHYLQNREIVHPREGRAYFNPEYLKTEQLQIIIDKTRNRLDKVVDEFIIDTLKTYRPFGLTEFKLDLKGMAKLIRENGYSKYPVDTTDLKNYLQDKRKMQPGKSERIRMPIGVNIDDRIEYDTSRIARCYKFIADDWLIGKHAETDALPEPQPVQGTLELATDDTDPFGTKGTKYNQ